MTSIKEMALSFCVILIIIGFFLKLFPKNQLENNIRNLLSVILLLILVSPFVNAGSVDYKIPISDFSFEALENEQNYKETIINNTLKELKSQIKNYLNRENIEIYDIEINYKIIDDSAEIKEIIIYAESKTNFGEIESLIEKEFGIKAIARVKK